MSEFGSESLNLSFSDLTLMGVLAFSSCTPKHQGDDLQPQVEVQAFGQHAIEPPPTQLDDDESTWANLHFAPLISPANRTPIPAKFQLRQTPDYFQQGPVDEKMAMLSLRVARCVLEYGELFSGDFYFGVGSYSAELKVMPIERSACWNFSVGSVNKNYLNPVDSLSYAVYNYSCNNESEVLYMGVDWGLNGRPNFGRNFWMTDIYGSYDGDIRPGQESPEDPIHPMAHLDYHTDVLSETFIARPFCICLVLNCLFSPSSNSSPFRRLWVFLS